MSIDNEIWNLAEAYVDKRLDAADTAVLQTRLETDPTFAANFQECVNLLRSLHGNRQQQRLRTLLSDIHKEQEGEEMAEAPRTIPLRRHYLRTTAVAASVALLASFSTWSFIHTDKKSTSQYNVLRHELENIKRSQNQIIQNISSNNKKTQPAVPASPARYSGSGFALTNNGYFVTNYHVTEGADSVYIQCHNGLYYKTSVVAFDAEADIAVLKVDDEHFRMKGDVPYTLSKSKADLGSKVYTLGYPDDQIVYNEGYISAKNGYRDDSLQYRLELPADPGQSGSPVLDNSGNVLGIVTAKGNQNGNTYAVSSKALVQFISHLPKSDLHLPKTNKLSHLSREQQIKKIEYYTCSVKVYKK